MKCSECESCAYKRKCFNCGFFDIEREGCMCPPQDRWYACLLDLGPKIEDFMTDPKVEAFMTEEDDDE